MIDGIEYSSDLVIEINGGDRPPHTPTAFFGYSSSKVGRQLTRKLG